MGKNDGNRYDNNKRFSEVYGKKEKRIKSPVSTGSKRSKERDALRKVVDLFSTKGLPDVDVDDDEFFDDLED